MRLLCTNRTNKGMMMNVKSLLHALAAEVLLVGGDNQEAGKTEVDQEADKTEVTKAEVDQEVAKAEVDQEADKTADLIVVVAGVLTNPHLAKTLPTPKLQAIWSTIQTLVSRMRNPDNSQCVLTPSHGTTVHPMPSPCDAKDPHLPW